MNRANTLPSYNLSPFQRVGAWVAVGAAGLVLAGCAERRADDPKSGGTQSNAPVYHGNGTRTYSLKIPYGDSGRNLTVSERCQDKDTMETVYLDEHGSFGGATTQEEPQKCADGKLTPEDFPAPPTTQPKLEGIPQSGV